MFPYLANIFLVKAESQYKEQYFPGWN